MSKRATAIWWLVYTAVLFAVFRWWLGPALAPLGLFAALALGFLAVCVHEAFVVKRRQRELRRAYLEQAETRMENRG